MKNLEEKKQVEVTIVDCGPREGQPIVIENSSSADIALLVNSLAQAGLAKIDCISFTHPQLIPRHSNAEELMQRIEKKPGVTYIGLAPSEVGCRRAVLTEVDEILAMAAVSDELNQAVLGLSIKDTLNRTLPIVFATASQSGKSVRGYILAAFGCPYSGKHPPGKLYEIVSRLAFMGAGEISLVDSTGMATPKEVKEIASWLLRAHPETRIAVHFHNTRGTGLVNCLAAYEAGVRVFDTAIGGLSDTPFGYPEMRMGFWNIPTEDLAHLFEEMGVKTGIDMDRLLDSVALAEELAGRALPGHLLRAGAASRLDKAPKPASLR